MTEKTGLEKLREPFPDHQISKLPKPLSRDAKKGKCHECGGYHGLPAVHIDYVGHASLTNRLLDCDPLWFWEPVAFGPDGLPKLDDNGGMWIKLTVCGVTRYGYGDAQGKTGGDAMKERIGDALRNAAMRFGAALDLWHKGDLHADKDEGKDEDAAEEPPKKELTAEEYKNFVTRIQATMTHEDAKREWQAASKACNALGDVKSSNSLKTITIQHRELIDAAAAKEKVEA